MAVGCVRLAVPVARSALAAGLSAGWNTPSTRIGAATVFSRQCSCRGGRCTQLPAEQRVIGAVQVQHARSLEYQHQLVIRVAVLRRPAGRDLAQELSGHLQP